MKIDAEHVRLVDISRVVIKLRKKDVAKLLERGEVHFSILLDDKS
jgi:hypothetical protein